VLWLAGNDHRSCAADRPLIYKGNEKVGAVLRTEPIEEGSKRAAPNATQRATDGTEVAARAGATPAG
jgi:hypothetical protein